MEINIGSVSTKHKKLYTRGFPDGITLSENSKIKVDEKTHEVTIDGCVILNPRENCSFPLIILIDGNIENGGISINYHSKTTTYTKTSSGVNIFGMNIGGVNNIRQSDSTDNSTYIGVTGNVVGNISITDGNVKIGGDAGNISTMNGSAYIGASCQDAKTKSGDIKAVTIRGSAKTMSGNIIGGARHDSEPIVTEVTDDDDEEISKKTTKKRKRAEKEDKNKSKKRQKAIRWKDEDGDNITIYGNDAIAKAKTVIFHH